MTSRLRDLSSINLIPYFKQRYFANRGESHGVNNRYCVMINQWIQPFIGAGRTVGMYRS